MRRQVMARAQGRCEYCQCWVEYATESFDVEHILPVSRGGTTTLDNLAYACSGCNGHKSNKVMVSDPLDGVTVPLYHPRQQRWQEHFGWDESYTQVIGLTPSGRATVDALQMNRASLINLRRLLLLVGKQPPFATK
jgi:hypothetical protein